MEETETQKTKVSDSGYSNSCSNSQSQRSSRSSKSRHSTSSGSSGYCAHLPNINDGDKPSGKRKDKDYKKKKDGQNSLLPPSPKFEPLSPHVRENGRREDSSQHDHADIANEALQLAALAQTLTTVKRLKSKSQQPDVENSSPREKSMDQWTRDEVMQLVNEETTLEEELDMLVSMDDGLVIYTTQGLTHILGYPKDMWIGRSLIDLIHPKHRATFAGHITSVIASNDTGSMKKNIFCCYLRQYRGLRSCGFSVSEKWVGYLPFELNISFRQTVGEAPKVCLAITASQIKSSYKYTNETKMSSKFTTRHTASAQLCHVDPQVTPHFGYLPQDIIGRSILEFYHPEDLHFLKEVYEAVMKEQGHPFKSKPYRFRCQNGGFALVETELLSFINPWSRKLEFIICQHTVLRGPPNPDVTTPVAEPETLQISEEVLKETKIIQEEIKCLLNERVVRSSETVKQQVSKRCKDLAVFMENLMDELTKPPHLKVDVPTEENNFSEQDSVMLGEISPHHEYYDSKLSTETPPSYNQLNYNENIQRFFESKPKTTLSEESKAAGSGEEGKVSPATDSKVDSKSGGSGGSSGTQSTATVSNEYSPGLNTNTSNNNLSKRYKPTALTEQLLCRHNEDMEKQMVKKHRELRSKSDRDTKIKERLKALDKPQEENNTHGIKRSGSRSWEGEPYKSIKAAHNIEGVGPIPITNCKQAAFPQSQELIRPGFTSTLMPMYYLSNRRPDVLFPQQLPYLGGMVYQPVMFSPRPLVYSPLTMVPTPNLSQSPENPRPPVQQLSTDAKHGKCNLQSATAVAHDQAADSSDTSVPFDDSSSSFYSLLKTEKSDDSLRSPSENDTKQEEPNWRRGKKGDGKPRPIRKVAPWIEDINVTEELVLKYQLRERPLEEVLSQDLQALQSITQPELVTEQLSQMYLDLELEGLSRQLALEEDSSSSESSGDEGKVVPSRRKYLEYDKMVILFEEDAPLPPPIAHRSCT